MKKLIKSSIGLLTLLAFIILSSLINNDANQLTPTATPIPTTSVLSSTSNDLFLVKKVIDGDTIELSNGQKVRYIGIDTPETVDPKRPDMCFGKEASVKNKELIEGKEVRLEKDVSETDSFGRLLRYIYIGDVFVNDYLVREGYAKASSYPPDVKYQEQFIEAEKEARENNRGLWPICLVK